ncbi:DUF3048 domain-containing protein [Ilumatobacter sp.]|uniref:DUF3048 domain-containing protein n=1 Tax=Ilumatobacter sp. TaxID=1967498 RepID=UPI0037530398
MTNSKYLAGAAALALVAVACSGGSSPEVAITTVTSTTNAVLETTTTSTMPSGTTSTMPVPSTTLAPDVLRQPLTGVPVASEADIPDRPALAVKIDNAPPARRNHSGLAIADVVFEEKVEGSLTRFAAVFHSQDADPVGPIRSGREQDVNLLSSLNEPLFGWSGGNQGVTRLIRSSFLVDVGAPSNPGSYYRGPGSAPHNLYSDTASLFALTPEDSPGAPTRQFEFLDDGKVFAGDVAKRVSFAIGSIDIVWDWNANEGRYERTQEGEKHVDKTYGQIGAQNVIVLAVDYRQSSIDSNAPEAVTLGEGQASVFSNGEVITGRWQKELAVYNFVLTDDNGNPIKLTPGQTWIELVEVGSPGDQADITIE